MDDQNFNAKLYSARLLPDVLKEYVASRSSATRTEKAAHFLDQVIKPSMANFIELLNIMEKSQYSYLKELAEQIRASYQEKKQNSSNG